MSAVQRTMHREDRGRSGHRPEEPWAFGRLPRRRGLRAYLIAVTATEFLLAAWQLTRLQPYTNQLAPFAVVLGCGVVCVEATRRGGAPPPGTHDLLTAWWLPAALFVLVNAVLIARAVSVSGRRSTGRDFESLLVDAAGLCAGVLVTIACTFSWAMLVVALPPVILLQRSLLHQQLRAAAQSDPQTGLLNAVAWQREAERWIRRVRRLSVPTAILLVDIDHFKRVNDTYGHLAGDELLAATASTLGRYVRACDVLGRFGGEEFVAVLPGAGQQEACHIAERLRGRVRDIAVQARGAEVTVTVSIGVAALGVDGADLFELLAAADAALYRAKKSGRDRVCTLPPRAGPSDPLR
jgi:diguanylate cyclase (GGDEF)-like protein